MNTLSGLKLHSITKAVCKAYSDETIKTISDFGQSINDIILRNPQYLLFLLSNIQDKLYPNSLNKESFIDGTFGGSFSGYKTLIIEADTVVLTRIADSYDHLIKTGQKSLGIQDLYDTSTHHGGGNGIPTSAFQDWDKQFGTTKNIIGTFKIPIKDLIKIFEEGNAILGNIGEGEIVLSTEIAQKYLYEFVNKGNNSGYTGLPDEINISL